MPDRHAGLPRAFDLTRLGYFLDFALVPIAGATLLVLGRRWGLGAAAEAAAVLAGVLAWSFAEYWIHRAVFHGRLGFEAMHELHHALPKNLIGVASWGTFAGFGAVWMVFAGLAGPAVGSAATAGFLLGYLIYCTVHVAIHHRAARGLGCYGAMMLALHQGHHRGGRGNFGVSSPLWDIVFGTFQPKGATPTGWFARVHYLLAIAGVLSIVMVLFSVGAAPARDLGQWEKADPEIRLWMQGLMQPDVPTASCCGEADAYWADEVHVRDGKTFAIITDERPDEPRGRPHIDAGTEIEIPNNKLKWDKANPTGHGVVFLSRNLYVFCYVQPGGV